MSTFHHPAFPDVTHTVPDELDDEAIAKGWLTAEESGYKQLAADPEPRDPRRARRNATQETSTACGEEATPHPSGLGKFRRESA